MIDWTASMQQTFEFYVVDPATWKDERRLDNIIECTIDRDQDNATLGSATIDCDEALDECYIRIYLVAIQNGITEKVPLGTFLVQTPSITFDGKASSISMDAYTPLIELKNALPPVGYSLLKDQLIMDSAYKLCRDRLRAPVVKAATDDKLFDDYTANLDDSWLTFITDLIANAKYNIGLDEFSRVIFEPYQDAAALRSVWTYNDNNSSILYPELTNDRDLYGIPNVVEVVYSSNSGYMVSRIENTDPNSPVSIPTRGREVMYRDINPSFAGVPMQAQLDDYARQLLRDLSCLEHKISYSHGYCPVRLGDCVTLNYTKAGLVNVRAKVISQTIKCTTGCQVEETAVYTTKLWR